MLHGFGRAEIGKALGKYLAQRGRGDGKPMPLGTVDDYRARVRKRWEDNPILAVEDERDAAIRRYKRRIVQAKTHADSARYEALLAKVTGLEVNTGTLQLVPPAGSPPGTPPTIDVNVTQRPPEAMTSQERRKEIEALEARRRAATAPQVEQAPPAGQDARPEGPPSEDGEG